MADVLWFQNLKALLGEKPTLYELFLHILTSTKVPVPSPTPELPSPLRHSTLLQSSLC